MDFSKITDVSNIRVVTDTAFSTSLSLRYFHLPQYMRDQITISRRDNIINEILNNIEDE